MATVRVTPATLEFGTFFTTSLTAVVHLSVSLLVLLRNYDTYVLGGRPVDALTWIALSATLVLFLVSSSVMWYKVNEYVGTNYANDNLISLVGYCVTSAYIQLVFYFLFLVHLITAAEYLTVIVCATVLIVVLIPFSGVLFLPFRPAERVLFARTKDQPAPATKKET